VGVVSGPTDSLGAGVIGTGSMGQHHARVYQELPGIDLVGVVDADPARATEVADRYGTDSMGREELLDRVDLVSIAVPTQHHYRTARTAIEHGVHLLVEKPFVDEQQDGIELIGRARAAGVTLQVGHIERFNPAVRALLDILPDLELIAVTADRLGPPIDRPIEDDVMRDLMIHDVDLLLSIVDGSVENIDASATAEGQYATSTIGFDSGVIGSLTASRVTQEKVRRLSVTARDCRVNVDLAEQSIQIHRHSFPEYLEDDGDVRYRYESVIERPSVEHGEPLRLELEAFVEAVRSGHQPTVDGEAGLKAVTFTDLIRQQTAQERSVPLEVPRS
jgi:predicted dehydrogenase